MSLGRLLGIADHLARTETRWRSLVRHDPDRRWFMRLFRTPETEAWLLGWTTSQAVELHDHGGSAGAVVVVDGELTELVPTGDPPTSLQTVRWRRGSMHAFGASHVHDLGNRDRAPATSIHVYSPPLSTMTFYARHSTGVFLPSRVEPVGD